jgi:hypothetical protein
MSNQQRRTAKPFKPSRVIYQDDGDPVEVLTAWIKYLYHSARALFVALLLGLFSISVSVFAYRLATLEWYSFDVMMAAIFRQPLPGDQVLYGTLIAGAVFTYLFMVNTAPAGVDSGERPDGGVKFLGGLALVTLLDVPMFGISSFMLYMFQVDPLRYVETLTAQGVVIVLLLCLIPLYNILVTRVPQPAGVNFLPEKAGRILGWVRFYLTSSFVILGVAYIARANLPAGVNSVNFNLSGIRFPLLWTGAILTNLVGAALFFWPPKYRQLNARFGVVRLVIFMAGLVGTGLLYRGLNAGTEPYLAVIAVSFALLIISIPLYYTIN